MYSVRVEDEDFGLAGGRQLRIGDNLGFEEVADAVVEVVTGYSAGGKALAVDEVVIIILVYRKVTCGAGEGIVYDGKTNVSSDAELEIVVALAVVCDRGEDPRRCPLGGYVIASSGVLNAVCSEGLQGRVAGRP